MNMHMHVMLALLILALATRSASAKPLELRLGMLGADGSPERQARPIPADSTVFPAQSKETDSEKTSQVANIVPWNPIFQRPSIYPNNLVQPAVYQRNYQNTDWPNPFLSAAYTPFLTNTVQNQQGSIINPNYLFRRSEIFTSNPEGIGINRPFTNPFRNINAFPFVTGHPNRFYFENRRTLPYRRTSFPAIPAPNGGTTNVDFQNNRFIDNSYPNDGFFNGGFPNNGFPNDGFPNGGFQNVGFPQGTFSNNGFPNGGFPNRGYPNVGFPNSGFPYSGFPNSGFSNGGFRNDGFQTSVFPNIGYPNTGFPNSGFLNGGFSNDRSPNSGYRNTGSQNFFFPNNVFPSSDFPLSNSPNNGFLPTQSPRTVFQNKLSQTFGNTDRLPNDNLLKYGVSIWRNTGPSNSARGSFPNAIETDEGASYTGSPSSFSNGVYPHNRFSDKAYIGSDYTNSGNPTYIFRSMNRPVGATGFPSANRKHQTNAPGSIDTEDVNYNKDIIYSRGFGTKRFEGRSSSTDNTQSPITNETDT